MLGKLSRRVWNSRQKRRRQRGLDKSSRFRRLRAETMEDRRLLAVTVGLQLNTDESFEGYTLFAPSGAGTTFLIDHDGNEVNRWISDFPPMSSYLLEDEAGDVAGVENGDLLRVARLPDGPGTIDAPGAAGRVELFDWDGNLKWFYELNETDRLADGIPDRRLHHDIEILPNGNILMIAWERLNPSQTLALGRRAGSLGPSRELWPGIVLEIKPDYPAEPFNPANGPSSGGEIVWEWHSKDHLVQQFTPNRDNWYGPAGVRQHPELINVNFRPGGVGAGDTVADWIHLNGIDYNADLDQIILSAREFSELWVIDHSTTTEEAAGHSGGRSGMGGDLIYRWGNPNAYKQGGPLRMSYQHDAQWIERGLPGEGNLLVFDNGWNRARTDYVTEYLNPGTARRSSYSAVHELETPNDQQFVLNHQTNGSVNDLTIFGTLELNYLDLFEDQADVLQPWSADWIPLTGDWDGDGSDSTGFYDPTHNVWIVSDEIGADSWTDLRAFEGPADAQPNWIPLTGDWDNDGTDTVALFDPDNNQWYVNNAVDEWGSGADLLVLTGPAEATAQALPLAGDWDGDGFDTVGFYAPQTSNWHLNNLTASWGAIGTAAVTTFSTGSLPAAWIPIAGDWNGSGSDTVGIYDPVGNRWILNNRIDGSATNLIRIGSVGAVPDGVIPLTGNWRGTANGVDKVGLYDPAFYKLSDGGKYAPNLPVWSYTSRPGFFATIISGAQRLPNGNTLINEGTEGRLFEVTPDRRIVWQYRSPIVPGMQGLGRPLMQGANVPAADFGIPGVRQNLVFRALRYAPDYPGLSGQDLTPQGPIETYPEYFDTPGIYNSDTQEWVLNNLLTDGLSDRIDFSTGQSEPASWIPLSGDWDGDGDATVGFYDPDSQTFRLYNETDGAPQTPIEFVVAGLAGLTPAWKPIVGDWDGNGSDTVGLYDPATSNWYLNNNLTEWLNPVLAPAPNLAPAIFVPIAGDWDGDGIDTVGLYDPRFNNWYLNNKTDGTWTENGVDGIAARVPARVPISWIPFTGDFNGNGFDSIGLYDPNTSSWFFNNRVDGSTSDLVIIRGRGGSPDLFPVIGNWNGSTSSSASLSLTLQLGEAEPASTAWNPFIPTDVNGDSETTAVDALTVVNALYRHGPGTTAGSALSSSGELAYVDVSGDGQLSALDALLVINRLRLDESSEGTDSSGAANLIWPPFTPADAGDDDDEELLAQLAVDVANASVGT